MAYERPVSSAEILVANFSLHLTAGTKPPLDTRLKRGKVGERLEGDVVSRGP